jgi:hypothetical protein
MKTSIGFFLTVVLLFALPISADQPNFVTASSNPLLRFARFSYKCAPATSRSGLLDDQWISNRTKKSFKEAVVDRAPSH